MPCRVLLLFFSDHQALGAQRTPLVRRPEQHQQLLPRRCHRQQPHCISFKNFTLNNKGFASNILQNEQITFQ